MKKTSSICFKIIGLTIICLSATASALSVFASPVSDFADIDAFSIGQIGAFVDDAATDVEGVSALKHENPAVVRIEANYRLGKQSQMVKELQEENLLNHIQMNEHAVYLQLRF